MDATKAKEILDKTVGAVFGYQNPLTLDQAMEKFAFDLNLPQQVYDNITNEATWATSVNPSRFVKFDNTHNPNIRDSEWTIPKRPINSIEDILLAWSETNYTATERHIESINVAESDSVNSSENVYRSSWIRQSKNIILSQDCSDSEFLVASSRSASSSLCIRLEDSQLCSTSFNVLWSAKVTNSFFIQDCYDVMDCMFCSHIGGKRYCIANMQFEKEEYEKLRLQVIQWIFNS